MSDPAALLNKGLELKTLNRLDEAMACFQQALALNPQLAPAHFQLGLIYSIQGRFADAIASQLRALTIDPSNFEAHNNQGYSHLSLGNLAEAIASFQRAIALKPDYAKAHYNVAITFFKLGKLDQAAHGFRSALAFDTSLVAAYINLGYILSIQEKADEAIACYKGALTIQPDSAEAYCSLGYIYCAQLRPDEAVACIQKALAIKPDLADAHGKIVVALLTQGDRDGALACIRRSLAAKSIGNEAQSTLLFSMLNLAACSPREVLAAHRLYAEQFETPFKPQWPHHKNVPDANRRLKIGYVSPDFRIHSVAYFIEPILAHHDKTQVEIYAYYSNTSHDAVTDKIRACVDHWIPCMMMSDAQLAERIDADGIDILVDLAGHTFNNRLLTFARKPAPVQLTYLGYSTTTGLGAMDYRLVTADTDPPGAEAWHSERLYRLPRSLWCYRPAPAMPAAQTQTPARRNGVITFGSMNNIAKVSPEAIMLWGRILRELPAARLVMTNVPEGLVRGRLVERFAAHGIDAARLTLHGKLPAADYYALLNAIDIALDPFPYTGTTTTCESLWMGVPVVTLIGETSVARSGYALLKGIGLEELAARDEKEYVAIATALAQDLDRLDALRGGMRARIAASPLRDEAGLTRDLEAAYRAMWRAWCLSHSEQTS